VDPIEFSKDYSLSVEEMEGVMFNAYIFKKN